MKKKKNNNYTYRFKGKGVKNRLIRVNQHITRQKVVTNE